jgi:hypothetical protein
LIVGVDGQYLIDDLYDYHKSDYYGREHKLRDKIYLIEQYKPDETI